MIEITEQVIDAAGLLKQLEKSSVDAGAVVSFTGLVRSRSEEREVLSLTLQEYPPMTTNGISAELEKAEKRWPVLAARIVHRVGAMNPGDTIVFVGIASKHRRAAFEAADYLMDYLKTRAVFWKKEVTSVGESWIEPRLDDYRDAERWERKEVV